MSDPPKPLHDNVSRTKSSSPLGRAVFIGLRAADVWWQYSLFSQGWASQLITKLGGSPVVAGNVWATPSSSLHIYYHLVSFLSLGSSIKQIAAMLFVSEQETPVGSAALIAFFNTAFNTINTLLAIWSRTSQAPASTNKTLLDFILANPTVTIGFSAYLIGILTEAVSEFQRRAFKKDPANKGKPYGGGLFSLATNINYGGYTVWRAGYAMVTGGWPWAATTFGFFFWDFAVRGVPVLDDYLVGRYGQAYEDIKARVKYRLIPWVY
ncbi:uncharacterized protein BO72DRAFT_13324 [Aspergillus fijiensis CBS 313.89]|uniref:Steroid 5-alpha reductase C-terminal domain-containing protein n=1 Tax=Aspergillus fijiensis CBS 313.89 TaxID=1448319 RepID=A0A8G1RWS4_9EURO|nr:uncharacterized protein BO72DRAFT_13324 [Aspergillus fijiensis CBS 313.89]RAK80172.1 hypothetical protein BO72DRAFT_13324 [Aspergillus fijiensis CBS 313.89]